MHSSIFLSSALSALAVMAAPTWPSLNPGAALPGASQSVSDYFNMLAQKVQQGRQMSSAPVCDLSTVELPQGRHTHNISLTTYKKAWLTISHSSCASACC
jgi:hypothetical protein